MMPRLVRIEARHKSIEPGRPLGRGYGSLSTVQASSPEEEQTIVSGTI
jgi:hypothetical protein